MADVQTPSRPRGAGEPGEIAVRPREPSVLFDGHHGRSELTLRKFRNHWFHTGDRGRHDAHGYLQFLGRADDLIRRGGENIAAGAVSAADVDLKNVPAQRGGRQ